MLPPMNSLPREGFVCIIACDAYLIARKHLVSNLQLALPEFTTRKALKLTSVR
jgi:hypothetical protein